MNRATIRSGTLAVLGAVALAASSAFAAQAGTRSPSAPSFGTVKWTKISGNTNLGIASAGLWRTSDGRLHVVWPTRTGVNYSLHYSTIGSRNRLLATGTVIGNWVGISAYASLISGPNHGMRLVFTGGNGQSGSPYNLSAMYTATSDSAGKVWKLQPGSMSQSTLVPANDTTATTQANGTPVAAWSGVTSVKYHVGIDPAIPATAPDQSLAVGAATGVIAPTLVRTRSGAVMIAFYYESGTSRQGYYVATLLPKKSGLMKAPNSGGTNVDDNEPFQPVAFTARPQGGSYLAYCVPTRFLICGHIAFWRVGAAKARTVPGSATGQAIHVAIAAGRGGHLWVMWYDEGLNKIKIVRTNAAATAFGSVRTIPAPPKNIQFDDLQAEGSTGPVDLIALALQDGVSNGPSYWATQIVPALRLQASKYKVGNSRATAISLRVTDAGDPVVGVTVTFLGKSVKTNSNGIAKFTVKKGTKPGTYTATAFKSGYVSATVKIKVT